MKAFVMACRNWLRVVLPGHLLELAATWLLAWCLLLAIRHWAFDHEVLQSVFHFLGFYPPLLLALAYGGFRTWYFHPIENVPYATWLRTTPWHYPQPLPLGPLLLVAQDAVVLGCLSAVFTLTMIDPGESMLMAWYHFAAIVPGLFLGMRGGFVWLSALAHRERYGMYLIPLLVGVILWNLFSFSLWIAVIVCVGLVCRFSLHRFVRYSESLVPGSSILALLRQVQVVSSKVWPVERMLDIRAGRLLGRQDTFLMAASYAWVAASCAHASIALHPSPPKTLEFVSSYVLPPLVVGGLMRLATYCLVHVPPMGLIGRIPTRRFIVPGYDRVLVAPLAGVAVGGVLPGVLLRIGMPVEGVIGVSLLLGLWALLEIGPSLDEWNHTGHHRLRSGGRNKRVFSTPS